MMAYRRCFELHTYYDAIAAHTFDTRFVDVPLAAARAWRVVNSGRTPSDASGAAAFEQVRASVAATVADVAGAHGAFVRLSTRSPKDAVDKLPDERVVGIVRDELSRAGSSNTARLVAMRTAFSRAMAISDGAAAFALMANSERIVSDIIRAVEHVPTTDWDLRVVVRRFEALPVAGEFRGFVHEGRLVALSQYFCDSYFAGLHERAATVLCPRILSYFDGVRAAIAAGTGQESYIVDFAVHGSVVDSGPAPAALPAEEKHEHEPDDEDDEPPTSSQRAPRAARHSPPPAFATVRSRCYEYNTAHCDACGQRSATVQGRRHFAPGMNARPCPRCGVEYNGALGKICNGCAAACCACASCLVRLLPEAEDDGDGEGEPDAWRARRTRQPTAAEERGIGVKIIEVNPWGATTGGCLFSWTEDRAALESRTGFEFRCRARADESEAGAYLQAWEGLMRRAEGCGDAGGGGGATDAVRSRRKCSLL